MIDVAGDITEKEVGGAVEACELDTRRRLWIRENKVAGCMALDRHKGFPTRLLFVGGGHIDVTGYAYAWALRLRIEELTERKGSR